MSNLYTLNRDYTLRHILGSITFRKGVPTHVPPMIALAARQIGAERVDGDGPSLLPDDPPKKPELTADQRLEALNAAFDLLVEKNDPADFTGAGKPSVKAIEKLTGFDTSSTEVNAAWLTWRLQKDEGK
jgi:hypothetical protein